LITVSNSTIAGLGLQRDDRGAEQIVPFAHRPVEIRPAITGGKVDEPELRIERRGVPDRRAAAHRVIGAGWPGITADLARTGQCVPAPQDLAGLGVECRQSAAYTELTAGDAAIDDPIEIERRTGDPVAIVPVLNRRLPHLRAGLDVERDHIGVELAEEQHSLTHRQPAIDPAAADGRDLLVDS
jgi:hypothetical protein